jgi:hypothetical protein
VSDLELLAAYADAIGSMVARKLDVIDHEAASDLALYSSAPETINTVAARCAAPIVEAAWA